MNPTNRKLSKKESDTNSTYCKVFYIKCKQAKLIYGGRSKNSRYLCHIINERGNERAFWGAMLIFCFLICVVVREDVYFVKIYWFVHFWFLYFSMCILHFDKMIAYKEKSNIQREMKINSKRKNFEMIKGNLLTSHSNASFIHAQPIHSLHKNPFGPLTLSQTSSSLSRLPFSCLLLSSWGLFPLVTQGNQPVSRRCSGKSGRYDVQIWNAISTNN